MLIQIKNLTKTYQRHDGAINAVDNLSLDIPKGSFVTITGASRPGKTMLLLMLGGLLRSTLGEMVYNGKEINLHNEEELANFLTVVENIMIALNVKNSDKNQNRKRAIELLEWVGLEDRTTHYPKELSAGQQQHVAITRALANNPHLLLGNEPTGNLDPGLSSEILNILKEINQNNNTTAVMVTHSPMAAGYGSTKIQLKNGWLQAKVNDVLIEQITN